MTNSEPVTTIIRKTECSSWRSLQKQRCLFSFHPLVLFHVFTEFFYFLASDCSSVQQNNSTLAGNPCLWKCKLGYGTVWVQSSSVAFDPERLMELYSKKYFGGPTERENKHWMLVAKCLQLLLVEFSNHLLSDGCVFSCTHLLIVMVWFYLLMSLYFWLMDEFFFRMLSAVHVP